MKKKKKARKSRPLLLGYMERISSKVFEEYSKEITALIGKQHGVYALYKGKRLYYVGLASNLRIRLGQHTKDKHSGKWDKFSIYLVRKADHIKELESLIMRVAAPEGNAARGKLKHADNLKAELRKSIENSNKERISAMLGERRTARKRTAQKSRRSTGRGAPPLAEYISKGFRIRGEYKGQRFRATVYKSGTIKFNGVLYNSPSSAAVAARGKQTSGWTFWRYKTGGEWVPLQELRRK
ncbi:DUF2924 domain-containing protein [bacterium]|nr:DUF2924 domain-containing protein [bacterium]